VGETMSKEEFADDYRNMGLSDLVGKTLAAVSLQRANEKLNDEILFTCTDGTRFRMYHPADCCEDVYLEDIVGDLNDLIGSPVLVAEGVTSGDDPKPTVEDSHTWTFYKIKTAKAEVTIRWYGSSNGYYSEIANFEMLKG